MKLKVLVVCVLGLMLSACGGGSDSGGGSDNVGFQENVVLSPNEAFVDSAEADEYFKLMGAPVEKIVQSADLLYGVVSNYSLEEYDRNLFIKAKESGGPLVYVRSPSVDVSLYNTSGDLEGVWESPCVNFKEVTVGSDGSSNAIYYSKIFKRDNSDRWSELSLEEYDGLNCERNNIYDYGWRFDQGVSYERTDDGVLMSLVYDEGIELTHKISMSEDGQSFIMYEGDNTYIVYYRQ